jgi:hypothetical protein
MATHASSPLVARSPASRARIALVRLVAVAAAVGTLAGAVALGDGGGNASGPGGRLAVPGAGDAHSTAGAHK